MGEEEKEVYKNRIRECFRTVKEETEVSRTGITLKRWREIKGDEAVKTVILGMTRDVESIDEIMLKAKIASKSYIEPTEDDKFLMETIGEAKELFLAILYDGRIFTNEDIELMKYIKAVIKIWG